MGPNHGIYIYSNTVGANHGIYMYM